MELGEAQERQCKSRTALATISGSKTAISKSQSPRDRNEFDDQEHRGSRAAAYVRSQTYDGTMGKKKARFSPVYEP